MTKVGVRALFALSIVAALGGCQVVEEGSSPGSVLPDVTSSPPTETATSEVPESLRRDLRTVVVDAGHGGEDQGAQGISGVLEKDVTLATAIKLARELRGLGFQVIETRTEDQTVSLPRRTEIANASRAGLFVSIHANSAPRTGARGIETYSMDLASDESALRLAERENRALETLTAAGAHVQRLPDEQLVEELRHGANAGWSRELAKEVHGALVSSNREFYGASAINDRGQRSGPFWVLLDSEIPSILVELGYLTHKDEEHRVRSHAFQEQSAGAIARGVLAWVERAESAELARPD